MSKWKDGDILWREDSKLLAIVVEGQVVVLYKTLRPAIYDLDECDGDAYRKVSTTNNLLRLVRENDKVT